MVKTLLNSFHQYFACIGSTGKFSELTLRPNNRFFMVHIARILIHNEKSSTIAHGDVRESNKYGGMKLMHEHAHKVWELFRKHKFIIKAYFSV